MRIRPQAAAELIAPPENIKLGDVRRVVQQLVHPVDDVLGLKPQHRVGQRLDDHLRPNAGWFAHADRDGGSVIHNVAAREWAITPTLPTLTRYLAAFKPKNN